jgi:hypothetical protein
MVTVHAVCDRKKSAKPDAVVKVIRQNDPIGSLPIFAIPGAGG